MKTRMLPVLVILLLMGGCSGASYHSLSQFPHRYPVRIDCAGCHKDPRGRFTHGRGWCDDHFKLRRYNAEVCSKCHENVQCRNCHRHPKTKELVWSDTTINRWYLPKDAR